MAQNALYIQNFEWIIETDNGLESALVQEITFPEISYEQSKLSMGNYDEKQPGRMMTGDMEMKKVIQRGKSDNWLWTQLKKAGDYGGEISEDAKFNMIVRTKDNSTVWSIEGAWVMKAKYDAALNKTNSDMTMEAATFSVDKAIKLI